MKTIIGIERAIMNWFLHFDQDKWVSELEEDVDAGKLGGFSKVALKDFREGKSKCRTMGESM